MFLICVPFKGTIGGEEQDGQAICLGTIGTNWLTIGDVSAHSSIAISTGHSSNASLVIDFYTNDCR